MLKLLKLASRNLLRYKTRTIVTIVAVMLSVLISIVIDGYLRGIFNLSLYNLISYESSEATIYKKGYFDKRDEYPRDCTIEKEELDDLSANLEKLGLGYAPRYKTPVDIIYYSDKEDVDLEYNSILVGIDPEKDTDVFKLSSFLESGRWPEKGEDGIVVGSTIAQKLSLEVGSFITLEANGKDGFIETFEEEVIAIVNTENPAVNSSQIFIDLENLDNYLLLNGAVTEVDVSDGKVSIAHRRFANKLSASITMPELEVYYYEDVNSDLMSIMNGDKGSSYMILFFLFIVASAGISNTMIMAVMERQKESGMMRALGFSRNSVNFLFMLEGALSGVIGALVGAVLAFAILYPLTVNGIDISSLISADVDYGYRVPLILRAGIYWQSFVAIFFIAIALSMLSSFFPVFRSGKEEIANILRRA